MRAFIAEDGAMITVHCGCDGRGIRPVLKLAADGVCVQLESWADAELVNVEEVFRGVPIEFEQGVAVYQELLCRYGLERGLE